MPRYEVMDPNYVTPCIDKYRRLAGAGAFSTPAAIGQVVVISEFFDFDGHVDEEEAQLIDRDRAAILDGYRSSGRPTIDAPNATRADLDIVFQEPNISEVVVLAHSSLGAMFINPTNRSVRENYTFLDVSSATNHLKTGRFYMRGCANPFAKSCVPLGTFAVHDARNVFISSQSKFRLDKG